MESGTKEATKGGGRISTTMLIMRPGELVRATSVQLERVPDFDKVRAAVMPELPGAANMEHVYVLYYNEQRDMFVDEMGLWKGLPRNEEATTIYRAAWLARNPGDDPETLSYIGGPAVLFPHRRVWR